MTTFIGPPIETETGVGPLTFGRFLEALTAKYGDREAILYVDAARDRIVWTYAELWRQASAIAKASVAAGVSKGTRVGILMGSRPEWVAATWGVVMAGGVAVLFNTFLETPELGQLLRHSDVALVLCQDSLLRHRYVDALLELCPQARTATGDIRSADYPFLRRIVVPDGEPTGAVWTWEAFLADGAEVPDEVIESTLEETVPTDDGLVIYSSGTTSIPKGVLHAHRAPMLQSWRHGHRERFTPKDRVYCTLPLFWTAGFAAVLGATLAVGACLVISPVFDPAEAARVIEEERVTIVQGLPSIRAQILECAEREQRDLSSVRRELHGRVAQNASYGSSETFTSATAVPFGTPVERVATHGALVPGTIMRVLHPTTGERLGPGQEGEIIVKGLTLMKGYVKVAPERTFDDEGFFHTGDTGWFDEQGLLHFTGRLSNVIKTSGANVAPLEVEEALLRHPDVDTAVVVGVPDRSLGEMVVVCVVPRKAGVLNEASIRTFLQRSLSSYKIPRRVVFFDAGEIPRTASNKVNVAAIRSLLVDQAQGPAN